MAQSCNNCFYEELSWNEGPCFHCQRDPTVLANWVAADFLKDVSDDTSSTEGERVMGQMLQQLQRIKASESANNAAISASEAAKSASAASGVNPLDKQISGDHYKNLKIQPIEFIHANNVPFAEGCAIKYLTRWRDKGGIKDLEKAKHFIELLIELETRS